MRKTELWTPFLEGGIRHTHYFNGRILTAEDLAQEQQANRRGRQALGKAAGEGVVHGLEVSAAAGGNGLQRLLAVEPGLAVNRSGATLCLPEAVEVHLVTPAEIRADQAGLFTECQPPSFIALPSGTGVYVFTIGPASGLEGQAPRSSLGTDNGVADSCDSRHEREGVRFGLVRADLEQDPLIGATLLAEIQSLMASNSVAGQSRLRNLLAHLCFGTLAQADLGAGLFETMAEADAAEAGLLGVLRGQQRLTDCDVPLGLLLWSTQGIRFVDVWSVRRNVGPARVAGWPQALPSRQQRLREAVLLQFQHQIGDLVGSLGSSQRAAARLSDYLAFLPPAGVVPTGSGGLQNFFQGHLRGREEILEEREWRALLDASLGFESRRVEPGLPVRVFRTLDNLEPPAGLAVEPFVLFASPAVMRHLHVPLSIRRGNSRLDSALLGGLFRDTRVAYQDLRRVILVGQAASRPPLTAEDHLGLEAIGQVAALLHALEERALGGSLSQPGAVEAFTRLAEAQRHFTTTYLNDVLPTGSTVRYGVSFRQNMLAIDELLTRTVPQGGINGLFQALSDSDLFSAATTQRAINQFLVLQVGNVPRGNIGVQLAADGVSPTPFTEGDIVNFRFELSSRTNIPETYDLVPILVADQQQAAWEAAVAFFDESLQPLSAPEIRLEATDQASVILQVQGVPAGTEDSVVRVQLTARSKRNPTALVGTSSQEIFTVGQEGPSQAADIQIEPLSVEGNGTIDPASGRVLVVAGTSGATAVLEARFQTQGLYNVEVIPPEGGAWVAVLLSPAQLDLRSQPMPMNIRVGLQPQTGAGDATVTIRVRDNADAAHQRTHNQPIGVG